MVADYNWDCRLGLYSYHSPWFPVAGEGNNLFKEYFIQEILQRVVKNEKVNQLKAVFMRHLTSLLDWYISVEGRSSFLKEL